MLKTMTVLHTPDLLPVLASMGHGDDVAIVDCSFPAVSMAQRLVGLDGASLTAALDACLRLMPLDTFVDNPALRMMQVHAPHEIPAVQQECQQIIDQHEGRHVPLTGIPREEFYDRAKNAYAIVCTGEMRGYGCILSRRVSSSECGCVPRPRS